jgi:hypothetical protein
MTRTTFQKTIVAGAALLALIVLAAGAFLVLRAFVSGHDAGPAAGRGHFREGAREAGITFRMAFLPQEQGENFKINLYDHGCGVAVGDFDGDGFDDIYFCNQLGPNALYRNRGDGTFEDVTAKARVGLEDRVCVGATWGDFDNDGLPDLYVTSTRGGNVLFKNLGNGRFADVTAKANLTLVAHSQTAVFFDYDNDGYLDLFVTNTARWTNRSQDPTGHYFPGFPSFKELASSPREYNVLYHNNRDGTFTDVTDKAGLKGQGWGGDVAVFDYNEDGYLDLLVTNMFGASQLYRNNGNGTFTEVTADVLGRVSFGAIGCKAFDYNNDGLLDLLIVDMHSDMWLPSNVDPRQTQDNLLVKYDKLTGPNYARNPYQAKVEEWLADAFKLRYQDVVFGNTLFQRLPSGKFKEVSGKANMETFWPWGIATGDFDNDGYEDVFLPSGMGFPWRYWPNSLMMNNGDGTFTDRAAEAGIEPPPGGEYLPLKLAGHPAARSSRCAAVADFTNKGRLDIIVNNFNDHPYYFRNHFPAKNYIAFRLHGTSWASKDTEKKKSNRDAIGAVVKIYMGKKVQVRQVQSAGGYLSQSSLAVHFGLGDHTAIDRVEIFWPSGRRQYIDHPAISKLHQVTEPD